MEFITIETPDRLALQGVWLGGARSKNVYIFLHGLNSNLFSQATVAEILSTESDASCLLFNNRGNGYISPIRKFVGKKQKKVAIGTAHEVFTDSRDDIAGAVAFAKSRGAKRIILVGHSTGCQKAVWYLAGKPAHEVTGAVLLAPLSDYSAVDSMFGTRYAAIRRIAEKLVRSGKPATLLPSEFSPIPCDAQRWLSLYTPESKEEIFTYASGRTPATLHKTTVPLLALFASEDEYADRPAKELAAWFASARPKQPIDARVVKAPNHGFSGQAKALAGVIRDWSSAIS